MRVTKTIKDYIDRQLNERRDAILEPYRKRADEEIKAFRHAQAKLKQTTIDIFQNEMMGLCADYGAIDSNGAIPRVEASVQCWFKSCDCIEACLPAGKEWRAKREEVNANFTREREELLVSLELGDMDKAALVKALGAIKLEG